MAPDDDTADVAALGRMLRANPAVRAKAHIGLVSDVLGAGDWQTRPGDDGAIVPIGTAARWGNAVVCGEALQPNFVAHDPYGAGLAAIVTNVNDLAAMGAVPAGIVDTIVADEAVAREVLRGLRDGAAMYEVPLVGGHLTLHDGAPALSAFGIGRVRRPLSVTRAAPGQSLVVACCTQGQMREDFPFFRSFDERGDQLAADIRLLASLAESGVCVAAKDVSMAGLIGSLAMLLEWGRLGVRVDLDAVPRPAGVPLADWLMCFPAFAFLLCVPPERVPECAGAFGARGLDAAVVGELDDTGALVIRQNGQETTVFQLSVDTITGLAR